MNNSNLYLEHFQVDGGHSSSIFELSADILPNREYLALNYDSIPRIITGVDDPSTYAIKSVSLLFLYDRRKYTVNQLYLMYAVLSSIYRETYTGIRFTLEIAEVELDDVPFNDASTYPNVSNVVEQDNHDCYVFLGDANNDVVDKHGMRDNKLVLAADFPFNPILLAHEIAHVLGLSTGFDVSFKALFRTLNNNQLETIRNNNFSGETFENKENGVLRIYSSLLMKTGFLSYHFRLGIGQLMKLSSLEIYPRILDMSYMFPRSESDVSMSEAFSLLYLEHRLGYDEANSTKSNISPFTTIEFDFFRQHLEVFVKREAQSLNSILKNSFSDSKFRSYLTTQLSNSQLNKSSINIEEIEKYLKSDHTSLRYQQLVQRRKFVGQRKIYRQE